VGKAHTERPNRILCLAWGDVKECTCSRFDGRAGSEFPSSSRDSLRLAAGRVSDDALCSERRLSLLEHAPAVAVAEGVLLS
jgi:hypothetical protein